MTVPLHTSTSLTTSLAYVVANNLDCYIDCKLLFCLVIVLACHFCVSFHEVLITFVLQLAVVAVRLQAGRVVASRYRATRDSSDRWTHDALPLQTAILARETAGDCGSPRQPACTRQCTLEGLVPSRCQCTLHVQLVLVTCKFYRELHSTYNPDKKFTDAQIFCGRNKYACIFFFESTLGVPHFYRQK
jgi:hypothetical protein